MDSMCEVLLLSSYMGALCRVRDKIMSVRSCRSVYALTRWLFWCLFPELRNHPIPYCICIYSMPMTIIVNVIRNLVNHNKSLKTKNIDISYFLQICNAIYIMYMTHNHFMRQPYYHKPQMCGKFGWNPSFALINNSRLYHPIWLPVRSGDCQFFICSDFPFQQIATWIV